MNTDKRLWLLLVQIPGRLDLLFCNDFTPLICWILTEALSPLTYWILIEITDTQYVLLCIWNIESQTMSDVDGGRMVQMAQ